MKGRNGHNGRNYTFRFWPRERGGIFGIPRLRGKVRHAWASPSPAPGLLFTFTSLFPRSQPGPAGVGPPLYETPQVVDLLAGDRRRIRILGKPCYFHTTVPRVSCTVLLAGTVTHDPAIFVASSGNEPANVAPRSFVPPSARPHLPRWSLIFLRINDNDVVLRAIKHQ